MTAINQQLILGIEATGSAVSVGISRQNEALGELWLNPGQPGGQLLLGAVDQLITTCKIEREQFEGICVCQGPGSFTGMRIALATVSSLAFAFKLPIYTSDRLTLAAATLTYQPCKVRVIQNAYKGELYHAAYDCTGKRPKAITPMELITPENLLPTILPGEILLGEGVDLLLGQGFDLESTGVLIDRSPPRRPTALGLIDLLSDQPAGVYDPIPLEPLYLRASEAEINYNIRFGDST